MPLLVYSYPDFTANTVIASAQVNAKYNDIKTLLNTTGLDDANVQDAGLTRSSKLKAGTANYVVINGADGKMSEEAALSPARGGLGISMSLSISNAGMVPQVDPTGTTFVLSTPPESPGSRLYNYNRFV